MENLFDLAQHLVNVLAGDDQASLLGFVQFPRMSRFYDFQSCFGHDSSK
jgi:hypothetical protein